MSIGVSVSPGKVKMNFIPNYVYEGTAKFGTGGRTPHLAISTSGEFDIIVDKEDLFCDREPCEVNYKVIMPESFDTPGRHIGYITAKEVFDDRPSSTFNVMVSMKMPIYIQVPYPGKYLEFKSFEATNKEAGEEIPFTAVLISRGEEVINFVKGSILIYDRYNNQIGRTNTNTEVNVEPSKEIKIYATWDSGDYEKGRYHTDIIVNYDGFTTNKTTNFKLGGLDVELLNYTKEIIIGGIKPFYLLVESIWGEEIPNLKASVSVLVNESNEITSFETLTKKLPAWRTAGLQGYLDTTPLDLGNYSISITLFFENLTKQYDGLISIIEESSPGKSKPFWERIFTLQTLLITLIILLVIMIIFLVIFLLIPKKKKKYKKG